MSYTPNEWESGDILTASKMNALEQAVAVGGGITVISDISLLARIPVSSTPQMMALASNDTFAEVSICIHMSEGEDETTYEPTGYYDSLTFGSVTYNWDGSKYGNDNGGGGDTW